MLCKVLTLDRNSVRYGSIECVAEYLDGVSGPMPVVPLMGLLAVEGFTSGIRRGVAWRGFGGLLVGVGGAGSGWAGG